MDKTELSEVLNEARLSFHWDEVTRTWQLERCANGKVWRSVMYIAQDQSDAEKHAIAHIRTFYVLEH
jgi:hypothetical protein